MLFLIVILRSNSSITQFRGFLIQARVAQSSPERATGSFHPPFSDNTQFAKFHNCDSENVCLYKISSRVVICILYGRLSLAHAVHKLYNDLCIPLVLQVHGGINLFGYNFCLFCF